MLRDIDLDVPAGELLCVLGPSGGGKSTLLRVIAGLEAPSRGADRASKGATWPGCPPTSAASGLMFQDYALFPHRDVGAERRLRPAHARGGERGRRARVAELLELVGLPGAERRPVSQLSGGEQQRVALARALAPRPRLLMLDEPMGSLDRALRERLPEELRGIFAELGLTVIYVTHDQDEALIGGRPGGAPRRWPHRRRRHARGALDASADGLDGALPGLPQHRPGAARRRRVLETPWGRLPAAAAESYPQSR